MKSNFFMFLMLFIGVMANAEFLTIPFAHGDPGVQIIQYSHMLLIENPESEILDTNYTFTNKESAYQLRYSFFKQTVPDYEHTRAAFAMFCLSIFWNIAGYEAQELVNFNDIDVKKDFNGDYGFFGFIRDPESDFCSGFKYVLVSFFCKENKGIIVKTLLFNNPSFIRFDDTYFEIYNSFRFTE